MDETIDIVDHISKLLDSGNYKEALLIPADKKIGKSFKDNCWDLITVIVEKVQDNTILLKPSLYGACEQMLSVILDQCAPEEALLEFIERVECAKNDAQFEIVLPKLQQLLQKLSAKRGRSLEWSLNSISTYVENIPIEDHQLEGDERKLIDSDPNIRRIIKVYTILPSFYKPFVEELQSQEKKVNIDTKQIITAFLISLLGKPIIFIDIDSNTSDQSEARRVCEVILQDICKLEKNVLKFLDYLELTFKKMSKSKTLEDSQHNESPYNHTDKINMTTLSGLFYCVYAGNFDLPDSAIPQVYSVEYVVHTLIMAVTHLLSFTEYSPLAKGLQLFETVNDKLPCNTSEELLLFSLHLKVCKSLVNIAIFCNFKSLRTKALNCIGTYINKFDYAGRCLLINYLIDSSQHSGMIGYAIGIYKNTLNRAFKDPELHECFTGIKMASMVKKMCYLPHGAESDLLELADQIIAALNFLRYLILKDSTNKTGIGNLYTTIEKEYLDVLRTGLNMSKAHYELKLKDLMEGKDVSDDKISINIGGSTLDSIPKEKKKEILQSALNGFHLIESLVARITEFINAKT